MNFFKELNRGAQKINQMTNSGFSNKLPPKNNDFLTELIRSCTYTDDVKHTIEKSVRQLLHVYPQYMADAIQFVQGGQQKRFVQLKGEIMVDYKGNVPMYIMYPVNFPKQPPFLRIVNPDDSKLSIVPHYQPFRSSSDPKSFLLNDCLQELKTWKSTDSVASIMIAVNDLIRNNYPFRSNNPQNQWVNNYSQNKIYPQQQLNKNNSWGGQVPQQAKQPPIPFKPAQNGEIFGKGNTLVAKQKEKLVDINKLYVALLPTLQHLEASKLALESESNYLRVETERMLDFVNRSDEYQLYNFSELVKPGDEISEVILNLNASLKAREETIQLLESKFNDEEVSLQDFLKNVRRLQQSKFQERFMLANYIQNFSRIRQV